jgi:hypothetical protein
MVEQGIFLIIRGAGMFLRCVDMEFFHAPHTQPWKIKQKAKREKKRQRECTVIVYKKFD